MIKNKIYCVFIFLIFVTIGCFEDRNNNIPDFNNNAVWTYFDVGIDKKVVSEGKIDKGLKIGRWSYLIDEDTYPNVEWDIYTGQNFELNYPKHWTYQKSKYLLSFNISNKKNNHFVILQNSDMEYSTEEYLGLFYQAMEKDTLEVLTKAKAKLLETNNNKKIIIYDFEFKDTLSTYCAFGAFIKDEDKLYDITYKIEVINKSNYKIYHKLLFVDIINSLKFNEKRIIPNIENIIKISDVNFS